MLKDENDIANQRDRRFSFRSLLVVGQLALAIVVLIGAGLCVKSLGTSSCQLIRISSRESCWSFRSELDEKKYDEAHGAALQRQVLDRLGSLPGVESVSYGVVTPFSGSRSP